MKEVENALLAARGLRPYYGRALAALQPVPRPGLGTVAVDKHWRLYVDPAWFAEQSPRHQAGVLACHEIEHLLRGHCGLLLSLLACDIAINDDVDPKDDMLPPGGCYPHLYGLPDGQTEEWYADRLPTTARPTCSGGSGAGCPLEDELALDDAANPGMSDTDADALRDQVADDVAAHVAAHGRGSVPAGIIVWATERRAAKAARPASWQAVLKLAVARAAKQLGGRRGLQVARHRLGRRSTDDRLLPAYREPPITMGCIVDTSGSMGGQGGAVLSEVAALLRAVTGQGGRVRWVVADAAVTHNAWRPPTQWRGGGGTDLCVAFDALKAVRLDAVVVLTDGDTPWPDSAPWPVVVATTGTAGPSWAATVRLPSPSGERST